MSETTECDTLVIGGGAAGCIQDKDRPANVATIVRF